MNYEPRVSEEFDEMISLVRNDVDLAHAIKDLLEGGLPIVRADVDNLSTSPTGDRILTYHLPDELKVLVATARAKKLEAKEARVGS